MSIPQMLTEKDTKIMIECMTLVGVQIENGTFSKERFEKTYEFTIKDIGKTIAKLLIQPPGQENAYNVSEDDSSEKCIDCKCETYLKEGGRCLQCDEEFRGDH